MLVLRRCRDCAESQEQWAMVAAQGMGVNLEGGFHGWVDDCDIEDGIVARRRWRGEEIRQDKFRTL